MPLGVKWDEKCHEIPEGPKLTPQSCPRLVAASKGKDLTSFLVENELYADEVREHGFAIYVEDYETELWKQEDDLLEFCLDNFLSLQLLKYDDVSLTAILIPSPVSKSPHIDLQPELMGVLSGLGISVVVDAVPRS